MKESDHLAPTTTLITPTTTLITPTTSLITPTTTLITPTTTLITATTTLITPTTTLITPTTTLITWAAQVVRERRVVVSRGTFVDRAGLDLTDVARHSLAEHLVHLGTTELEELCVSQTSLELFLQSGAGCVDDGTLEVREATVWVAAGTRRYNEQCTVLVRLE